MAYGFAIGVLHDLVRNGLATATRESAIAARRGIVVTRLRITDAGRRALTK
jgi:hydrogenase maturation factor